MNPASPPKITELVVQVRDAKRELSGATSTTAQLAELQDTKDRASDRGLKIFVCCSLVALLWAGIGFFALVLLFMGFAYRDFTLDWRVVSAFSGAVITNSWLVIRAIVNHLFPREVKKNGSKRKAHVSK